MKLTLIGTGLMGFPMSERLLAAGFELTVYNRTREKALPLEKQGARVAASLPEAFQAADTILLMLTDAPAIRAVLFPDEVRSLLASRTIIQMGTILPVESQELRRKVERQGGKYLEAPVLGSIPNIKSGTLITMVSAPSERDFQTYRPIFQAFSSDIYWVGEVGKAAALKLALNQLIASLTSAFSLSLGMIRERQIDVELFMDILRKSALYAPTFDKKLPRMVARDFQHPNFPAKHLLKDVNLIAEEARSAGLNTAVVDGVREVIKQALDAGYGEEDYSVIYNAIHPPK